MTLKWVRGENPYRLNHFTILQIGVSTGRPAIVASRKNIVAKLKRGKGHVVAGHALTEADVLTAEARLLREESWLHEALLTHSMPPAQTVGGVDLQQELRAAAEPLASEPPTLTNPAALAPLLPGVCAADLPWPSWEELGLPHPTAAPAAYVVFDI